MSTGENNSTLTLEWFDALVVLTSLIECIDSLSARLAAKDLGDDAAYDLECRLDDYRSLALKLKVKYAGIADKGELPQPMRQRLEELQVP